MIEIIGKAIKYLNENPGVGILITGVAVLVTIAGWFIKKHLKVSKSNEANVKNVKESNVTIDQKN